MSYVTTLRRRLAALILALACTLESEAADNPTGQPSPPSPAPDSALIRAHELCASGRPEEGRAAYAQLAADANAPAALRSVAQLSLAQSWRREKDWGAAEKEYAKVLAMPGAPAHHRQEAEEQIRALTRLKAGQPPRDPAATRTLVPQRLVPGAELHVSPGGSDANPGTLGRPFATLERARDEIRRLKQQGGGLPPGGVAVSCARGAVSGSAHVRTDGGGSGSERAPVVYRAAAGEAPVFSGGARLTGFEPVRDAAILRRLPEEARGKVVQADLKAHGITSVPPVRVGGFASGRASARIRLWSCFSTARRCRWRAGPTRGS